MADFDADAARAAGHSDAEIAKIQSGIAAARAAGYSDDEIKAHLGGASTGSAASSSSAPADPGWSAGRVLGDLGHYPAMGLQAAAQGVTGLLNFPGQAADAINRYTAPMLPEIMTTSDLPGYLAGQHPPKDLSGTIPSLPTPDLGKIAQPQNAAEAYGSAAIAGGTAALAGGAISRLPALLQAGGKEIVAEVPRLLHEAGILGAIPGVTVEAAERNLDLDKLDPGVRTAVEATIGATAAIAAHRFAGGNPVEGVAAKLGDSANADEAGQVAQAKVRDWRGGLNAKLEALKGEAFGNLGDGTYGTTMFGKVPLAEATTDNTETMRTLGELSGQGGVYKDVMHAFVSDLPPRMKAMFESIAQRNNPIVEYPPLKEKVPSGPLRNDNSPIINTTSEDLTPQKQGGPAKGLEGASPTPVSALSSPAAGLLAPPNETPIAARSIPSQTNPLQQRMATPGVMGVPPGVESSRVQLPSTVLRGGPPVGAVDPNMSGSRQVGDYIPTYDFPPPPHEAPSGSTTPRQDVATRPAEPAYPPKFEKPTPNVIGFKAPLQDTMDLRSAVGEWISNPKLMPKGVTEAQSSALYKSLTQDIGNTMERYGAGDDWADYNAKASSLYHAGNMLSKIASDVNPTKDPVAGGKAVESLWGGMRKDSSEIANLRAQVPEAANEVAAAFLRNQPEKWAKLPRATQEALVPNPFDRLVLHSSSGKPPSPLMNIQHLAEIPSMGSVGYVAGKLAESYAHDASLGATAPPYAMTAAAMALPPAARMLGRIGKNPRLLNVPITGGVAGAAVGAGTSPLVTKP